MNDLPRCLRRNAIFQRDVLSVRQLLGGGLSKDFLTSQVDQGN